MSADPQNVSSIEKDLMLVYICKLYETFIDETPVQQPAPKPYAPPPPTTPQPVREEVKPQPIVVVEPPKPIPPPVVETPKYIPPTVAETPKYAPPSQQIAETSKYAPPPPVVETPKYQPPPIVEAPRQAPVWNGSTSSETDALFENNGPSGDISDKLALAPIADLTKALALNDKILFINELFGGNATTLDQAIKYVNGLNSFTSASLYLKEFAAKFNWAATDARKKQALSFIKLVRRRFR